MLKQLQTSGHRFCTISALNSADSPEKMNGNTKLRATSGQSISTSREAHLF